MQEEVHQNMGAYKRVNPSEIETKTRRGWGGKGKGHALRESRSERLPRSRPSKAGNGWGIKVIVS